MCRGFKAEGKRDSQIAEAEGDKQAAIASAAGDAQAIQCL